MFHTLTGCKYNSTQQRGCGCVELLPIYQFSCFDFLPTPQASHELTVDGVSADRFLTAFTWDEAKHPARRPLRETVDKLQESVAKVDDEFKVKTSEYAMVKSQLNGLTRKAGGSLATRDLGELVQGADVRPHTSHIVFESYPSTHPRNFQLFTNILLFPSSNLSSWIRRISPRCALQCLSLARRSGWRATRHSRSSLFHGLQKC